MGHLGVVLYEYLGEEYPEVLGSILGALKGIVNVNLLHGRWVNWDPLSLPSVDGWSHRHLQIQVNNESNTSVANRDNY